MMIKRFLLFTGEYEASRFGWYSLAGDYETINEAKAAAAKFHDGYNWYHIVDIDTGEIVADDDDGRNE